MGVARRVAIGFGLAALFLPWGAVRAQSAEQPSSGQAGPAASGSGAEQGAGGTSPYGVPEADSEGVLRSMADRAAVIFVGTVTEVHKGADQDLRSNASASVVEVDFAVEHGIKGATDGSVYALREWAGLWRDSPRFVVGQRLLMLLHAAGPGGLSSPVGGLDGAIPVKATDSLPTLVARPQALAGNSAADTATSDTPQDDAVDLRWLQAKALRVQTFADEPVASPGESLTNGLSAGGPVARVAGLAQAMTAEPATAAGLRHVLGLLKTWRETRDVSR